MALIQQDTELERLEEKHLWLESMEYCREQWEKNRDDYDCFMHCFVQRWMLTAFFEDLAPYNSLIPSGGSLNDHIRAIESFRSEKSYAIIQELLKYGDLRFGADPRYLCLSGYMIDCTPLVFLFACGGNYEDWTREGSARLSSEPVIGDSVCSLFARAYVNQRALDYRQRTELFPGNSFFDRDVKYRLSRGAPLGQGGLNVKKEGVST